MESQGCEGCGDGGGFVDWGLEEGELSTRAVTADAKVARELPLPSSPLPTTVPTTTATASFSAPYHRPHRHHRRSLPPSPPSPPPLPTAVPTATAAASFSAPDRRSHSHRRCSLPPSPPPPPPLPAAVPTTTVAASFSAPDRHPHRHRRCSLPPSPPPPPPPSLPTAVPTTTAARPSGQEMKEALYPVFWLGDGIHTSVWPDLEDIVRVTSPYACYLPRRAPPPPAAARLGHLHHNTSFAAMEEEGSGTDTDGGDWGGGMGTDKGVGEEGVEQDRGAEVVNRADQVPGPVGATLSMSRGCELADANSTVVWLVSPMAAVKGSCAARIRDDGNWVVTDMMLKTTVGKQRPELGGR
ncbi:hypothetical protein [Oryza sativa Japonica Group]|uniref:non-specific serine/threonine protein kinase n=1 Tax=Oryza sativa subsp. japonica TaxID=39947 RepID=Q5ZB94_ORYSJ|nr:hypothetical protein [Oryza sativa Japonica Group]